VSKAFTKEDDDAGFTAPATAVAVPSGPFRLTRAGAEALAKHPDARARAAAGYAEVVRVDAQPVRATLGVTVGLRGTEGGERRVRLVSPEEFGLLGEGCSIQSPLGRALLGAEVGDVREVQTPRGASELEVISLEGGPG
jgi:transcription elongation GreA/GreB family factor